MKLNILSLVTDEKCYAYFRAVRWSGGISCPSCQSKSVVKNGHSSHNELIDRYECKDCGTGFNDLTGTIFAQSNKPLKVWIIALYFLGLNLSNRQIAQELDMSEKTAQRMTEQLRAGIVKKNLIYDLASKWKQMKFIFCGAQRAACSGEGKWPRPAPKAAQRPPWAWGFGLRKAVYSGLG